MLNPFNKIIRGIVPALLFFFSACKLPSIVQGPASKPLPAGFQNNSPVNPGDSSGAATIPWRKFFGDKYLENLIDTALQNNQELLITLQDIVIARNDIMARQGKLMPSVMAGAEAGLEKVGRFTSQGAGDASTDIKPGLEVPEWLPNYQAGAFANWEMDIWKKLRNAKESAINKYLATVEGKNFVITGLVAEVAENYYELLGLDNQLDIIRQTIQLQQNALEVVRVQKQAARVTELAVRKFEAEVLNSQSMEYEIRQQISETENKINFLLGRYPQPIERDKNALLEKEPQPVQTGIPSALLANRPDIKQAEYSLTAARLDLKVARAEFYPSFEIRAGIGLNAFKPAYLTRMPESLLFNLAGDLAGPLINKNAIRAEFNKADAEQLQALYEYDKAVLNAYLEVATEITNINNLEKAFDLKNQEVKVLSNSVDISNELFRSARADYFEVLMTQRDALDARLELVSTREKQYAAVARLYRSLGGGWN